VVVNVEPDDWRNRHNKNDIDKWKLADLSNASPLQSQNSDPRFTQRPSVCCCHEDVSWCIFSPFEKIGSYPGRNDLSDADLIRRVLWFS